MPVDKSQIRFSLILLVVAWGFLVITNVLLADWTVPTQGPPYGQPSSPFLSTGTSSESKLGPLEIQDNFYVTGSGNVGINTTTVAYKLNVDGTSYFSSPVVVGTPTADNHAATKNYVDGIVGDTSLWATSTTGIYNVGLGNVGIGTATGQNYKLYVNGSTYLKGETWVEGRVYAGTEVRTPALYANGNTNINIAWAFYWNTTPKVLNLTGWGQEGYLANGNGGDINISAGRSTGTGTSAVHFSTAPAGSSGTSINYSTEKMTILGNGNIGIGTVNPNNILSLGTSLGDKLAIWESSTSNFYGLGVEAGGHLYFKSSGTRVLDILSTGSVGINTTSPQSELDVNGTIKMRDVPISDEDVMTLGYFNDIVGLWSTSTDGIYNTDLGKVGIGTANPSSTLHVVGSTTITDDLYLVNNKSIRLDNTTSTTLFIGNYGDSQAFGYGASTTYSASLAVEGAVKANQLCFKDDCKSDWSEISGTGDGYWTQSSGYLYPASTTINVGIGTTSPEYALDVSGKIALDGTVIAYRPTAFTGTLVLGDGGGNLSHASGLDGYYNTFVGLGVGSANTTGNKNTANGVYSLYHNTEGISNTANGEISLYSNVIGDNNTANGVGSLYYTIGDNNTADGFNSLYYNTGSHNTALGANSGKYIADGSSQRTTGDYGLYLGYNSKASAIGTSNEIVIGYDAIGNGSNTVTIGSSSIATTILRGDIGVGTTSPQSELDVYGLIKMHDLTISQPEDVITKSYLDSALAAIGTSSASSTCLWATSTEGIYNIGLGDVGIGTTSPTAKLDVNGNLAVSGTVAFSGPSFINEGSRLLLVDNSGTVFAISTSSLPYVPLGSALTGNLDMGSHNIVAVNKLTVTTIDPLYDIRGVKYSTYVPSLVGGVKEEYIGKGDITACDNQNCSWQLDFDDIPEGSDLWVWRQVIDFQPDKVDVLMTAYGRPVSLSYEIGDNQIIFYADEPTRFTYRLIGARYDWRKWPTLAVDQSETASMIIK